MVKIATHPAASDPVPPSSCHCLSPLPPPPHTVMASEFKCDRCGDTQSLTGGVCKTLATGSKCSTALPYYQVALAGWLAGWLADWLVGAASGLAAGVQYLKQLLCTPLSAVLRQMLRHQQHAVHRVQRGPRPRGRPVPPAVPHVVSAGCPPCRMLCALPAHSGTQRQRQLHHACTHVFITSPGGTSQPLSHNALIALHPFG